MSKNGIKFEIQRIPIGTIQEMVDLTSEFREENKP